MQNRPPPSANRLTWFDYQPDTTGSYRSTGQEFGRPDLEVREGSGRKLQFLSPVCVLDAYLYPPPNGQGVARVAHVDARRPSGVDIDVDSCLALLAR